MSNRRITITELANELKTTPSTVSRALRNHDCISVKMRKRVHDLAEKKNYTVNRIASSLRSGSSKTLGVIVPRVNRDFFSNIIYGIEEVASKEGYTTVICQTHDLVEKEESSIYSLIESNVAGIMISTFSDSNDSPAFMEAKRLGIPIVFFDRATKDNSQNKVVVDDKMGAFRGVEHLIEQGFRRIVHFAGPQHIKLYNDRKAGYLEALKKYNIPIDDILIYEGITSKDKGYEVVDELLKIPNKPDAIFAASDFSALGALIRIKELGISIPGEMGILGFSNEMFTSITDPKMTTIDQHSRRMGNYAIQTCLEAIKDEDPVYKNIVLDPTLIIRESTNRTNLILKKSTD